VCEMKWLGLICGFALASGSVAGCDGCANAARQCQISADCTEGEVCVERVCRDSCSDHAGCDEGLSCANGACLPTGGACTESSDCLSIETCVQSRCRLVCSDDAVCDPGHSCQAGTCLPGRDATALDAEDPERDAGVAADRVGADLAVVDSGTDGALADAPGEDVARTDATAGEDAASPDAAPPAAFAEVSLIPGGSVSSVEMARGDPMRIYARIAGGRVFRNVLPAGSWTECARPGGWISSLAVAPADPDTRYAGVEEEVLVSVDGCASWQPTGFTRWTGALLALADGTLLAGATDGLWQLSVAIWQPLPSPLDDVIVWDLSTDAAEQNLFAVGDDSGVFRSVDGGTTWLPAVTGLRNLDVRQVDVSLENPARLVAAGSGAHFSTDTASHWTPSTTYGQSSQYDIAVDPEDPSLVVLTSASGIRASTDGGDVYSTSDRRSAAWHRTRSTQLMFATGGGHQLLAATDSGVRLADLSVPGTTPWSWSPLVAGMEAWSLRELVVSDDGSDIYAATPGGLLISHDGGDGWELKGDDFGQYCFLRVAQTDTLDASRLFVGGKSGIYLSEDGAQSFSTFYTISHGWGVTEAWIAGDQLYAGTDAYFAASSDGGDSWQENEILGQPRDVGGLLVIEGSPNEVLVATDSGVYSTTDDGLSFVDLSDGLSGDALRVEALVRGSAGALLAGTADGLYLLPSGGGPWQLHGFGGVAVNDLVEHGGSLDLAAASGVFTSDDGGDNWIPLPGLAGRQPWCLANDASGARYVGTHGFGLHRSTDPS